MFVAESVHNRPRTCNNVKMKTMSEMRRHLTRGSAGYPAQLSFLRLCRTCNEDFTDRAEFEQSHGYRGEFCNNVRSQRRRGDAKVQWEALYRKIEAPIIGQTYVDCEFSMRRCVIDITYILQKHTWIRASQIQLHWKTKF